MSRANARRVVACIDTNEVGHLAKRSLSNPRINREVNTALTSQRVTTLFFTYVVTNSVEKAHHL